MGVRGLTGRASMTSGGTPSSPTLSLLTIPDDRSQRPTSVQRLFAAAAVHGVCALCVSVPWHSTVVPQAEPVHGCNHIGSLWWWWCLRCNRLRPTKVYTKADLTSSHRQRRSTSCPITTITMTTTTTTCNKGRDQRSQSSASTNPTSNSSSSNSRLRGRSNVLSRPESAPSSRRPIPLSWKQRRFRWCWG